MQFREFSMHGSLERVKRVAPSADMHAKEAGSGRTALHKAAFWGHEDVTQYLLGQCKLDVNVQVRLAPRVPKGVRARELLCACACTPACARVCVCVHASLCACVRVRGQRVKSQDFNGDTPLHDAVKFGHIAVAKTLLAARAQV